VDIYRGNCVPKAGDGDCAFTPAIVRASTASGIRRRAPQIRAQVDVRRIGVSGSSNRGRMRVRECCNREMPGVTSGPAFPDGFRVIGTCCMADPFCSELNLLAMHKQLVMKTAMNLEQTRQKKCAILCNRSRVMGMQYWYSCFCN
jgi:hypothetical protein